MRWRTLAAALVVPALITMAAPAGALPMAGERGASDAPTTAAASSFDDDGCQDFVTWCLHVGETGYLPLGAVWTEGNCTATFTLNWGDGSPPETRTLTNSADIASHVYTNVGLYTATAASQIVAGCWPTTDYGATSIIQVIDLTADAGGPYTVVRAETVTLDASASVGPDPITSYRWDFTPGANCPSGTTLRHKTVTKTDP